MKDIFFMISNKDYIHMKHFRGDSTLIQKARTTWPPNTFQTAIKNTNPDKNELHHQTKASKDITKGRDTNQRKKSNLRGTYT